MFFTIETSAILQNMVDVFSTIMPILAIFIGVSLAGYIAATLIAVIRAR